MSDEILFSDRIDFGNDFEEWRKLSQHTFGWLPSQAPQNVITFLMSTEKGKEWVQRLVRHRNAVAAREAEEKERAIQEEVAARGG